jgi:cytochrome c oxidase subunit I+III
MEWLPNDTYATRSIPFVTSREPIWDQPNLAEDVEAGRYYLPGAPTGGRETIITSPIEAKPQYLLQIPGPSWPTVLAAFGTAAFFLLLTVKLVIPAFACGVFAMAMAIRWLWSTDPGPTHHPVDIGGGIKLPVYVTGPASHSWWAMVVLMLVAGSIFASLIFSYFFLWTVSPDVWPGEEGIPGIVYPIAAALLLAASSGAIAYASRALRSNATRAMRVSLVVAIPLLIAAIGVDLYAEWRVGLTPTESSYGALVYTIIAVQGFYVATLVFMGLYTLARSFCGLLNRERRATFDNTMLLWHYTVAQGLIGLALVHSFPRAL